MCQVSNNRFKFLRQMSLQPNPKNFQSRRLRATWLALFCFTPHGRFGKSYIEPYLSKTLYYGVSPCSFCTVFWCLRGCYKPLYGKYICLEKAFYCIPRFPQPKLYKIDHKTEITNLPPNEKRKIIDSSTQKYPAKGLVEGLGGDMLVL